ncbi:lipoprotein N-acyltransferase Lnb domain-containing protein [Litoribacter ruber]|uniref:lipoprotein N-acyltransferase Lnb domain-containing protein n=1 Tax=Litoribacter ruber TaxID=702568 RepID=UPI00293D67AD|nr:DUF4105 domain-containing protein [Litoribacter ruber]
MKKIREKITRYATQKVTPVTEKKYVQDNQKTILNAIVLILFFTLTPLLSSAQTHRYQISLLTCDPGEELYSSFGHSALRVLDMETGKDLVFNWGTFDFDDPNFYLKFTQGRLDYFLSLSTFEQFLYHYRYFERGVREQVLNLSPEQVERTVALLNENARPENIYYRYDFFYDNCSTRIRDIMEAVLGRNLDWNEPVEEEAKTFRDLIFEYVYRLPWADFGIDLALGSVIDQEASEREKQFLPDYMEAAFARAEIVGDGPSRLLAQPARIVLDYPLVDQENEVFNPHLVFWLVAIGFILLTYVGYKKHRLFAGADVALFAVLGLIGVVITFLWFFTEHTTTVYNWNILWAFPAHLVLLYGLTMKTPAAWVKQYLFFAMLLANLTLVFWILGFQDFHSSIIPILLIIILRSNYLYYNLERLRFNKTAERVRG